MPQSKAIALKLSGNINDYSTQRQLDSLRADITYDLQKLWPMVHPMMIKPGQEDPYKDLKIAGAFTKTFTVNGSYPTEANGKPLQWYESVRTIQADGDLTVGMVDTSGINIQNLDVPITLQKGIVTLKRDTKSKARQFAKPATINSGTLDLSAIALDIGQETMRLNIPKNHKLVQRMTINPLLGDTLGKYVNPVFANAKRAQGLFEVTIDDCQNLALGEKMKSPDSGKARMTFSLLDMDIANPLGSLMFGKLAGFFGQSLSDTDTFRGQIRNAVVTLDRGRTTQKVTMELAKAPVAQSGKKVAAASQPSMPLTFDGDIQLATLQQRLAVTIPTDLIASGGDWKKIFPSGIPISLKGTTTKPEIDVGDLAAKIAKAQAENQINKALGGKEGGNPLDKIGDIFGGNKSDDQNKDKTPPKKKK